MRVFPHPIPEGFPQNMTDLKRRIAQLERARSATRKGFEIQERSRSIEAIVRRLAGGSFAAAIFFAPFRYRWLLFEHAIPPVYSDYTDGLVFLSDIFLVALLALWLLSLALRPRRLSVGPLWLAIPLSGLALVSALSAVFSVLPSLSFYHLARLMIYAGLYLYIVNEVRGPRSLLPALAAGAAVQAAVGVGQWLAQADLGLQRLGEYELDPAWNGVSIVWAEAGRSLRAYGLSDHPNILGGLLVFSLVLLLAWYIAADRHPASSANRTLAAGVFALGLAGLFLTFSRSAWLGLIAAAGFMAALLVWKRRWTALLDGAALLAAGLIVLTPLIWRSLPYLGVRLNAGNTFAEVPYEKSSLGERAVLNEAANAIFADNALNGVGLGTFPVALRQAQPDFGLYYQPPHMVMLEVAAETGLFGALFYGLAVTTPWLALMLRRKRLNYTPELIGAYALLLAISVVSLFDYYPWLLAPGRFWAWLAWGWWAATFQISAQKD